MAKVRGFRVGHRVRNIFKWVITRKSSNPKLVTRLNFNNNKLMPKLCSWINSLKQGAKRLCLSKNGSGYVRVGQDPDENNPVYWVPRGHLAIYVGEKEDDVCRVLVPLMYFNHPLFEGLLKEAENVYGFNHPGGIQIPCRISDFENVKTKIVAAGSGGNLRLRRTWKRL